MPARSIRRSGCSSPRETAPVLRFDVGQTSQTMPLFTSAFRSAGSSTARMPCAIRTGWRKRRASATDSGPAHSPAWTTGRRPAFRPRAIDVPEIARGVGRLVPAEAEADDAPPGPLGVEIEDARGGRRAPVPHEIEEDAHAPAAFSLVLAKDALERVDDVEPVQSELLHDGRRDRDLGPPHVLPREARHEPPRDERIVGGAPKLPADVAVEAEEGLLRRERAPPRANGREIGEDGVGRAGREADESGRPDGSLEVQVKLHFRRGDESAEEGEGVSSGDHARASYERPFETGPVPLGTPPRERLWMRAAAFGVDLILVAGVPLLLASAIVFCVHAFSREAPAGLDDGFRAAQVAGAGPLPLPRRRRRKPGKEALRAAPHPRGRGKAGALQSLLQKRSPSRPGLESH